MMQGDSCGLTINILRSDGTVVTDADISDVEVTVGFLKKRYKDHAVTYNADSQNWRVPLTQEETFKLPATHVKAQVRVVWTDGSVEGASLGHINVLDSISKEVL